MSTSLILTIIHSDDKDDCELLEPLKTHLSSFLYSKKPNLKPDYCSLMDPNLSESIKTSNIILILVSAPLNRLLSKFDLSEAYKRQQNKECEIIPIFLRDCYCKHLEYYKFRMIPTPPTEIEPRAVNDEKWGTVDKAITRIIEELVPKIDALKGTTNDMPLAPSSSAKQPSENEMIINLWKEVPLNESEFSIRRTVNCNRKEEFTEELLADFLAKENQDCNLVYLICACSTQNPASIAKRLVYENPNDFMPCSNGLEGDVDEIEVTKLRVESKPKNTWNNFWKGFQKKILTDLSFIPDGSKNEFEDFIPNAHEFTKLHNRIPYFCLINDQQWSNTPKLEEHVQYIIEQFSKLPVGCHKFVLFFIFELIDLHQHFPNEQAQSVKNLYRIESIKVNEQKCVVPPFIKAIKIVNLVEELAMKAWIEDVIVANNEILKDELVQKILDTFKEYLHRTGAEKYPFPQKNLFPMNQIEKMQYYAFSHMKNKRNDLWQMN